MVVSTTRCFLLVLRHCRTKRRNCNISTNRRKLDEHTQHKGRCGP
uniref:Uncharacterized protein n=1 Tax=Arundo donax TaxID=35708 RepID=A0A0A8Y8S5_ARUDO